VGLPESEAVWRILEPIIRGGDVYALPPNMSEAEGIGFWFAPENEVYCAEEAGEMLGVAYLRENSKRSGQGVANGGYATAKSAESRGVARALCLYTLQRASELGFREMQFNYVISTNSRAVRLWKNLGFVIAEVLLKDFEHPRLGHVDVFVMVRPILPSA
jgi:GNAT superfamily N-acetyltransferase